jgi:hypothetical protein
MPKIIFAERLARFCRLMIWIGAAGSSGKVYLALS